MGVLYTQDVTRDGLHLDPLTMLSDPQGAEFTNSGVEVIVALNTTGLPYQLILPIQTRVDGQTVAPRAAVIPPGGVTIIGPFPPGVYGERMQVAWGETPSSGLGLALVKLGGN